VRFAPNALSVVVVGDVESGRAVDAAERVFGGWSASASLPGPVPSPRPPGERRRLVIPMPDKAQVDIAYGFVTVRRSAPDYYAYWLMNNVLGQYAMGGRLGTSIRERQG